MSGGFFRGTSADQDTRFSNKQAKLLKSQKFPPELENLVDMSKVKIDVLKPWIAKRVTELIGFEDEVLINFIYTLLEGKAVNGKQVQISLTGFMERNTGKFMKELWTLLISAQQNASGVPQEFLDAKEEETKKKKAETDRLANEIHMKREKEKKELEEEKIKMDGRRGTLREKHAVSENDAKHELANEDERHKRNGSRRSRRVSRSSDSPSRSPSPSRKHSPSPSKSSNSLTHSRGRRSRSISGSPKSKSRSISSERQRHQSPRRSITPHRRHSTRRSISPRRRRSPPSRQRSISRTRRRSPSPSRYRVRSSWRYRSRSPLRRSRSPRRRRSRTPVRRSSMQYRSRSPVRRRSPPPMRRRSPPPVRRGSPSPVRRRSPSPVRRRAPSPVSRRSPSPPVGRRSPSPPVGRRSPSPVGRRSPSPVGRRSPSPVPRRSPSPVPGRSPSGSPDQDRSVSPVRRRSSPPVRRRSPSPDRRRSPPPVRRSSPSRYGRRPPVHRRRSPVPTRRRRSPSTPPKLSTSPVPGRSSMHDRDRSLTPVDRRSPSDRSSRSPSPIRRHSPSPVQKGSPRRSARSPVQSPRRRAGSRKEYSPHRRASPVERTERRHNSENVIRSGDRKPAVSLRSPQRDSLDFDDVHGKDRHLSPSVEKSKLRDASRDKSHGGERRSISPRGSPYSKRERMSHPESLSSLPKAVGSKPRRGDTGSRVDDRDSLSRREIGDPKLSSSGKVSPTSTRRKDSLDSAAISGHPDTSKLRKTDLTRSDKHPDRVDRKSDGESQELSTIHESTGVSKGNESSDSDRVMNNNRALSYDRKGSYVIAEEESLPKSSKNSEKNGSVASDPSKIDDPRVNVKEKRKHRKLDREEAVSDDYSSEDSYEDRRESKKRRKEEKKLKKEERRRRREERRRKKEDKRAEKLKSKSVDSGSSSYDLEQDRSEDDSVRRRGPRSKTQDSESRQKKLEIELREKALESLRAKRGAGN